MEQTISLRVAMVVVILGIGAGLLIGKAQPRPSVETPAPAPTTMQHTMDSMSAGLEGKTGDEFDKAFLKEMIVHHEGAVEMAHAVHATSKRPELLKLADDIISAQTSEIELMKQWQHDWFGM
jgi:uncharacterized protein (DUF305 family)